SLLECEMNSFRRFGLLPLLALATVFSTAGCRNNQDQAVAASGQNDAQDPATANMAPVSADQGVQPPAQSSPQQSAPAPYVAQQNSPPPNGAAYTQASYQAP